jgi:hypothetical protein
MEGVNFIIQLKNYLFTPFKYISSLFWLIRNRQEMKDVHSTLYKSPDYPNSALSDWQGISLAIGGSSTTITRLGQLAEIKRKAPLQFGELQSKVDSSDYSLVERKIRSLFDESGSDKGSWHHYSYLYATLLGGLKSNRPLRILEIGLGTNNIDTPSNMGSAGIPGASLRAFRDFDDRIECVGLDIDSRVLFEEDRIDTGVVDQMDLESWNSVPDRLLQEKFDLVIDDGLHSPSANLNTIISTKGLLSERGVIVVEDIAERSLDVWHLLGQLGIPEHELRILAFPRAFCAVIARRQNLPELLK